MKSRDLWILAGLVVVGLLVRATRLGESLWYDEIAAWRVFGMHGPAAIVTTFSEPSNHIAHTLVSWCSVKAFEWAVGFELALRLPALLFSLGAVAAVYGLARCASGPRVAMIAAGNMLRPLIRCYLGCVSLTSTHRRRIKTWLISLLSKILPT